MGKIVMERINCSLCGDEVLAIYDVTLRYVCPACEVKNHKKKIEKKLKQVEDYKNSERERMKIIKKAEAAEREKLEKQHLSSLEKNKDSNYNRNSYYIPINSYPVCPSCGKRISKEYGFVSCGCNTD